MNFEEFAAQWSELHGGAPIGGVTGWWLSHSYKAARIASKLRITPNLITVFGVLASVAMATSVYAAGALCWLLIAFYSDGIDGSTAILQSKQSRLGSLFDSLADRISEALWMYMGYLIGIPLWMALSLWCIASTQEYARARLASLGYAEIGVITIGERPVRAIFMAILLILFIFAEQLMAPVYWLYFAVTVIAFVQLMMSARRKLQ